MQRERHPVSRAQFARNLHDKESDPAFLGDTRPLLRADVDYDAVAAMAEVKHTLVARLPSAPWRGSQ